MASFPIPWVTISPIARAFRVYITQRSDGAGGGTTTSGYMNLRLGLAATVGGPNICCTAQDVIVAGATGVTSSEYGAGFGGNYAWTDIRGDNSSVTYWHSAFQSAQWWAYIDFGVGNAVSVSQLFIMPTNVAPDQRTPYEFYFQISPDAVNWTNILYVTGVTGWALGVEKAWIV